jgi:hypothetical protein
MNSTDPVTIDGQPGRPEAWLAGGSSDWLGGQDKRQVVAGKAE